MIGFKKRLRDELSGWTAPELLWLGFATAVIVGVSVYWKESVMGILSALTGVWCVILTGKGKLSAFLVGTVNTVLYAWIAYGAKYYGDVMLNLLFYLPTNFIGLYTWNKNMNDQSAEVIKKRLTKKQSVTVYSLAAVGVLVYGLLLSKLGGSLPFVDSTSTVLSVVAQILCIKRMAEQWIMWIAVDVVTVVMWIFAFFNGGESVATLLMWSVYLLNAVFMYIRWKKEAMKEEEQCAIKLE